MLTALLLATFSNASLADDLPTRKRLYPEPVLDVTEVALGASMGVMWIDLGGWNDAFEAAGWPRLGAVQITPLSINGVLFANRHAPGFDFIEYQNVGGEGELDGTRTFLKYTFTELSYGFAVLQTKGWSILPRGGLGLANVRFDVQPTGTSGFGDVTAAPSSATFQKSAFFADLAFQFSYMAAIGGHEKTGIQTGFRFTIQVGGIVQLFDTAYGDQAWRSNGEGVTGAPGLYVGGPYARFIIAPSLIHRAPHERRAR